MIGRVEADHALMDVAFRSTGHPDAAVECVVDTGFTGYLTLPLDAVLSMGLQFIRRMPAKLADNSTILVEVYAATIMWNGRERRVEVLATDVRPLIGTLLLRSNDFSAAFVEGGEVLIRPI
jgi:clan AA aspartic protease